MANRYWVGGTATWDATAGTKWATTSGGTGGEAVPTAADDVFIDAASGTVTITSSGTTVMLCRSLNFAGFTGTLTHAASTTITIGDATAGAGNVALNFSNTMSYSRGSTTTAQWAFVSTSSTPQTLYQAAHGFANTTFNGVGGSWICSGSLRVNGSNLSTLTLTAGTLNLNGYACYFGRFSSSNTNVRSFITGNAALECSGTGALWTTTTSTNLTATLGTSVLAISSSSATAKTLTTDGVDFYAIRFSGNNITWNGTDTVTDLYINTRNMVPGLLLQSGFTKTVTGAITTNGMSGSIAALASGTAGSPATISKASGTVSVNYMSIQDSTATGGATFYAGANSTNVSGNTGWIFTNDPASVTSTGNMLMMFQ